MPRVSEKHLLEKGLRTCRILKRHVQIDVHGVMASLQTKLTIGIEPPREMLDCRDFEPCVTIPNASVDHVQESWLLGALKIMEVVQEDVERCVPQPKKPAKRCLDPGYEPRDARLVRRCSSQQPLNAL